MGMTATRTVFFKEQIKGRKNPSNINPNPQTPLHPLIAKKIFGMKKSGALSK